MRQKVFNKRKRRPDALPALTHIPNGQDEVDLSWNNASQSATGYVIEQSTDGTTFTSVGTVGYADVTTFSSTLFVGAATQYYYRVRATDASSESAPSNVATTVTAPTISITADSSGSAGSAITLHTSVTYATGQADPVRGWTVDWGNGGSPSTYTSDPGSFTHTYNTPGNYTITATTADGSFTDSATTSIAAVTGTVTVSGAVGETAVAGTAYSMTTTFTDADGEHVDEWLIDWGDGTINTRDGSSTGGISDTEDFSHTYAEPGDYSVTAAAETAEGVDEGSFSDVNVTGDSPFADETIVAAACSSTEVEGESTYEVAFSDDAGTPGEHTYTIYWGDSTTTPVTYAPTGESAWTAHQYNDAGSYVVKISDGNHTGYTDATVTRAAPTVAVPAEQVVSAGSSATVSTTFSGLGSDTNAAAYIDWGDGSGLHQLPSITYNGDGTGTLTATLPSTVPAGAHTATFWLFPLGRNAESFDGDSVLSGSASFTLDVWGAKIDSGEKNDLLWASPDGTHNLQPVVFSFPRPSGHGSLSVTITSTDLSEDVLWGTSTPTSGDTPLLGGSSGPTSYTFTLTADQSTVTFWAAALVGDATPNVDSYEATATPITGVVTATTQSVSNGEFAIHLRDNPNTKVSGKEFGQDITDQNNTTPTNWIVGQVATLVVSFVDPLNGKIPKYHWDVNEGSALYNWGWQKGNLEYTPTKGGQPITPVSEDQWKSISESVDDETSAGPVGFGPNYPNLSFFWPSTDDRVNPSTYAVRVTVNVGNGPSLSHTASFKVFEPTVSDTSLTVGEPALPVTQAGEQKLSLGDAIHPQLKPGLKMTAKVTDPAGFSGGTWAFLQTGMISEFTSTPVPNSKLRHYTETPLWDHVGHVLDGGFLQPGSTLGGQIASGTAFPGTDTPSVSDGNDPAVTGLGIHNVFDDYIMYRPVGQSCWVAVESTGEFTVRLGLNKKKGVWVLATKMGTELAALQPTGVDPAQPSFKSNTAEPDWSAEEPGTVGTKDIPLVEIDG